MRWFHRPPPGRPSGDPTGRPRFAALQAAAPAKRAAALAGAARDGWIEAAAAYGLVEAQLLFGQILLDRNQAELALRWFRAAAGAGYAPAVNMVGRCLELGWGTPADPAAAAVQYRRAAEQGLDWAQFNLGMLLLYGLGLERDRRQAAQWFGRAAAQRHAKAANMLGRCHEEGWTGPRDLALASRWYAAAAAWGDYRGQYNLGTLLLQCDRPAALLLFAQALAGGSADFRAEAAAALSASGDPELARLAA